MARRRMATRNRLLYFSRKNSITGLRHSFTPFLNCHTASAGAMPIEYSNAPTSAKETVHAMGLNNRPSTLCNVKIGRYAVMIIATA